MYILDTSPLLNICFVNILSQSVVGLFTLLNCLLINGSQRVGHDWVTFTFFFFFSILLIYLFILLYNIVLVLPYIDMNLPWVYMCSPSWTPLPPPSPSHPSGSSQCTSPEHPVSYIEPGLAIHFTCDNLHVSMPFSHIILLSPSPTESQMYRTVLWDKFFNLYFLIEIVHNWSFFSSLKIW